MAVGFSCVLPQNSFPGGSPRTTLALSLLNGCRSWGLSSNEGALESQRNTVFINGLTVQPLELLTLLSNRQISEFHPSQFQDRPARSRSQFELSGLDTFAQMGQRGLHY